MSENLLQPMHPEGMRLTQGEACKTKAFETLSDIFVEEELDITAPASTKLKQPAASPEASGVEAKHTEATEIDFYLSDKGRINMCKGSIAYKEQEATESRAEHLEPCKDHKSKYWVFGVLHGPPLDEEGMRAFAAQHIPEGAPFMLGQGGLVQEIVVVYRCETRDRHKPKLIDDMKGFTTTRGGNASLKVIRSIQALMARCKAMLSNISMGDVDAPASLPKGELSYEEVEEAVLNWGTKKFVAFGM